METRQHQEWRSRQQLCMRAVFTTALFVGGLTFVMSGGSPWSTAGTMNAIVGRDVPWNFAILFIGHFVASFIYAFIIALAVYRLRLIAALIVGVGVGMVLSVISREIFTQFGWVMQSPETRAFMTHTAFGLYAVAVYKGASVPPPEDS